MNAVLDIMFTLIEGCCLLYLVKNEQIKHKRQVFFAIFYIVTIFGLTQMFSLSELGIKVVFTCGSVVLFYYLILDLSMKKSIFYMMIGEFLLMVSELLIINMGWMFQINPGVKEDVSISTIHIIISKIIYITLLITVQKIISDVSRERFDIKILFFFICSNIGYMVVGTFILANILYTEGEAYSNMLLVCSVVLLFTFIINVFFSNKYSRIENEAQQQRMAIYKLETQTRYYEEKMRDEERIKEIYHDMKNHLLLLEEEWGEKHSTGIENLRKEMAQYENYYRTGNKFVDIILKDKLTKAAEYGIHIEDSVELIDIDFIEPLDLSTVFGNLLDNAIEACRLIEEPEKRQISISSKRENNILVISIKNNRVCGNIKNAPKKVIHGYGLANVTAAVHKYEGEIDIMEGEQEFAVNIVIPIKKGEAFT
ncbi:GHKL domain-containing protein [Schaedlerella sp.]|uniref:sensor histidine kinase n=1 Tax=Schaedlerella sp. TaxID=2676057 RepID=UPI003745764E